MVTFYQTKMADEKIRKRLEEIVSNIPSGEDFATGNIADNYLVLYDGGFTKDGVEGRALTLLDPKTEKYEVLSDEDDSIHTAVPYPDGRILYAGSFKKDGVKGGALTLLDPKTKKYKVLSGENGLISTAVPYPDGQILYAGEFTKKGVEGRALTLLDPKTGEWEILAEESNSIHTAVPVPRSVYGHLLSK